MVQILPLVERKPSFSQRLSVGISRGLEMGDQLYQQHHQKQQMIAAAEQLGIDPAVLNLPEQGQAAYFKNKFAPPQKGMTSLQESQQKLADARLNALQQNQELFQGLTGNQQSKSPKGQENIDNGQDGGFDISKIPEDKLRQVAAFKGQPGLEGTIGNMAEAELKNREKKKEESPDFQRSKILTQEQAKADTKFYNELNERKGKQILKEDSLKRIKQINKKGVSGKVYEKVLDSLGLTAKTSEGRRELSAEVKNQFTDFKQIAGSQLSAAEFFVLAGAYPNADFTKEANEAIINNLEQVHDTLNEEYKIAQRLKKENGGKLPENFQEKVNSELQGYVSNRINKMKDNIKKIQNAQYGIQEGFTLMFDPEGNPMSVPEDKVADLLDQGASLP